MGSGNPDETYKPQPMRPEFIERAAAAAGCSRARASSDASLFPAGWRPGRRALRRRHRRPLRQPAIRSTAGTTRRGASTTRTASTPPPCCPCGTSSGRVAVTDEILEMGAKVVLLPTGPAYGRSPGDPYFDPIWSRLNEAGVTVAFHIMPFWYFDAISPGWGHDPDPSAWHMSAWQWMNVYGERPIDRHPLGADLRQPLRPLSRTSGCSSPSTAPAGFPTCSIAHGQEPGHGPQRALDRRQARRAARAGYSSEFVRVAPYPEDDIPWIVEDLGGDAGCLVMGSDFPHAEGMAEPADFVKLLDPARRGRPSGDHAGQRRDPVRPLSARQQVPGQCRRCRIIGP